MQEESSETTRKKQAQAWGAALVLSAQNMGIPAHSSSVPVSAVGAAVAQENSIWPTVQHDSAVEVGGDKRLAPNSAEELPVLSVRALHLSMIEEETAGDDMIEEETAGEETAGEETPSSPPCSGQELSAEQYGMNTPGKAARGGSSRGVFHGYCVITLPTPHPTHRS